MERVRIKARERKKAAASASADMTPIVQAVPPQSVYGQSITVRYGTALYGTIRSMIASSHAAEDFTFVSSSDFIRAALRALKDGMQLTELDTPGEKRETKLRVDEGLKQFYQSLPKGMRNRLLERAMRTYLKNM